MVTSPREKNPWIWWNAVLLDSPKLTGWVSQNFDRLKPEADFFLVKNELSLKRLKGGTKQQQKTQAQAVETQNGKGTI